MDNRPIGVFDSGLGGLTAVKQLEQVLPGESLVYFGDTGRVPYGSRGKDTILRYARQDMDFLLAQNVKAVLAACGTVSSTARDIGESLGVPYFDVVLPTARAAAAATKNKKVGVIGTNATIHSDAYRKALLQLDYKLQVFSQPCPLFVPLVENGRFRPGDIVIETVAAEYLAPLKAAGVDTLVLGCTHYPLLEEVIAACMGPGVALVSAGAEGARAAADFLRARGALSGRSDGGACRFFVSDRQEDFARLASIFLGRDVTEAVELTDISQY